MNAILILLIVIVLLLVYIILFAHGHGKPKDSQNTLSQQPIQNERTQSIMGKTKTSFPSRGTEGKPEEADENREEKPSTFAPETSTEATGKKEENTDENEFHPMPEENEIDADEVEKEELSILLDEEIEVSDESPTAKEILRMQRAAVSKKLTEEEKPALQKTVDKLRGTDFLEKLKVHQQLQSNLNAELMRLIAGKETDVPVIGKNNEPVAKDWTSFL